jgi:uncharacterized membrane protein YagU involved in acid resistance
MVRDLIRGAVAGIVGTWLMDLVTTALIERQPKKVLDREEAARPGGKTSLELMVERIEETADFELAKDQRALVQQWIHYALGAVPGALYVFARERIPGVGLANGLVYGGLLFLVDDVWLNWKLGFAGPPDAYPTEAHLRGLLGHLVLGATTEVVADLL